MNKESYNEHRWKFVKSVESVVSIPLNVLNVPQRQSFPTVGSETSDQRLLANCSEPLIRKLKSTEEKRSKSHIESLFIANSLEENSITRNRDNRSVLLSQLSCESIRSRPYVESATENDLTVKRTIQLIDIENNMRTVSGDILENDNLTNQTNTYGPS